MDRITYSYLILNMRQIIRCSTIHPISMNSTYRVIMSADPINCCKSTANPMVARKVREINRPRSRFPRSFWTGFNCASPMDTVVRIRSRPAFQKVSGKMDCAITVHTKDTPKPMVKSHAISRMDHLLSDISGSSSPSSSSSFVN